MQVAVKSQNGGGRKTQLESRTGAQEAFANLELGRVLQGVINQTQHSTFADIGLGVPAMLTSQTDKDRLHATSFTVVQIDRKLLSIDQDATIAGYKNQGDVS